MATSYANSGGSGARSGVIAISTNIANDPGSPGTAVGNFIDGVNNLNNANAWDPVQTLSDGDYVRFDFGAGNPKYCDEIKIYSSGTPPGGSYKFRATDDLSAYTVGATFTWNTGTSQTVTISGLSTAGYRYFELTKNGGSTEADSWWREIEFKIDAGVSAASGGGSGMLLRGVG